MNANQMTAIVGSLVQDSLNRKLTSVIYFIESND